MRLLVIVLCLLSERFLIHSISYQRFSWFNDYYLSIKNFLDKNHSSATPWVLLAAVTLPIVLIVSLIYLIFAPIGFGLLGFIFSIALFFYCLGPQNAFYPLLGTNSSASNNSSVGDYLVQVNSQLFAVIFWYILAGPIVLLIYRLVSLSKNIPAMSAQASLLTNIFEWLPARMTVLLYLLVGNFQRGFSLFMSYLVKPVDANAQMLRECGLLAVRTHDSEDVSMPVAENFVEHALMVLLVFIALLTIVWL